MDNFVHLHLHSENSILDGMIRVDELTEKVAKMGQPGTAITDHGVLSAAPELYFECRKRDLLPIIGEEFYVARGSAQPPIEPSTGKVLNPSEARKYTHLVLLAANYDGYRTLVDLSSTSHQPANFYYKPRIDRAMLSELRPVDRKNLIVLSGCWQGSVSLALREDRRGDARDEALWLADLFPNFYLEIQDHRTREDRTLNKQIAKLGHDLKIPVVATNDAHFLNKQDAETHSYLLAIQTGSAKKEEGRFDFTGTGYWVNSRKNMEQRLAYLGPKTVKRSLDNTVRIARGIDPSFPLLDKRTWHIPQWRKGNPDAYLRRLVEKRIKTDRLPSAYRRRLRQELSVVETAGVSAYYLIVRDIINRARRKGIRVGVGRGSVGGSAVAWAIGITRVDPIKYDLLFDRFLSPARPKLPDIDVDFSQARRDEVVADIERLYGIAYTSHLGTFGRMAARGTVKAVGGALRISFSELDAITKEIEPREHLPSFVEREGWRGNVVLEEAASSWPDLFPVAARLQGLKKYIGTHASGIMIGDKTTPMREALPTMRTSGKQTISQYDMYMVEKMGLLKMDILGLRTLDTIDMAVHWIAERHGVDIDPDELDPFAKDSKPVYRMLAEGKVSGVFQMEGGACEQGCKEVGVREFEDVVAITALYRPGPDRFIGDFISGRKNPRRVSYPHPRLQPILEKTFGVIVYQEQAMEIGGSLAGFDAALVDEVKETIKAKDPTRFAKVKPLFIRGCHTTSGMSEKEALALWDRVESFAGYGYNRAHAVEYSLITYQTAWLKYYYPIEFFSALLATTGKDTRQRYHREAALFDVSILAPDINRSGINYQPYQKTKILMGLGNVKYVGASRGRKLVQWRLENGRVRTRAALDEACGNTQAGEALVKAGATRKVGLHPEGSARDLSQMEVDYLGTYVRRHPIAPFRTRIDDAVRKYESSSNGFRVVGGLVVRKKVIKDRNKNSMCFLDLDLDGTTSNVVVFSSLYDEVKRECPEGSVIMVGGRVDAKKGSIIAAKIVRLDKSGGTDGEE